jgi:hypothetical protein
LTHFLHWMANGARVMPKTKSKKPAVLEKLTRQAAERRKVYQEVKESALALLTRLPEIDPLHALQMAVSEMFLSLLSEKKVVRECEMTIDGVVHPFKQLWDPVGLL